ncbi:MAG: NAD(P)/FAD-dependent oxidoreductase [Candidatus Endonucleobacter bathymodioli]|uniref:NAD(P)/FAD-dependent oxidoreductase n=1 Tax=Candidatus Endonucleibacter bathymodioli TaxID=539814 RepID=A0AA90NRI8_9GAMM|nr:NAD(P)/FAD-dependent oxidoreductase [Candidatus Endonucleobacter bathymodioli]
MTNQHVLSKYDVIIIGAGASGMMCALTAARRGRKVLVIEHSNKVGKKILISGGGRCNYTNMYIQSENYLSQNPHFCKSALSRYSQWDFQTLVEKHKIPWHEKTAGQLFCDNYSKDIVNLLVDECHSVDVTILLKALVFEVINLESCFSVNTSNGIIQSQSLVIATGGLSFPTMGATDFGYKLAQQFGHSIVKQHPGLVPFTFPKKWLAYFGGLAGISAEVIVSYREESFRDKILFTHKGLSGPAILQISSYWTFGHSISINWLPNMPALQWLKSMQKSRPKAKLTTVLTEVVSRRLAHLLCGYGKLDEISDGGKVSLQQITLTTLTEMAESLEYWSLEPLGTEGYKKAEVTLGGVSTDDISSKTFESFLQPGLFFIGEVLDVTGGLGGFNFQWAWSSGYCSGLYV